MTQTYNTTTDITIVESAPVSALELSPYERATYLQNLYPGLRLPGAISDEQLEELIINMSAYTGAEPLHVDEYLSRKDVLNKTFVEIPIPLWGAICYNKQMTNEKTGEVVDAVGVVYKVAEDKYMSFTSQAAKNFYLRSVAVLRPFGDWRKPLAMTVRQVPLNPGHTFAFKLVPYKQGMEEMFLD